MNPKETVDIFNMYFSLLLEAVMYEGIDYMMDKEKVDITNPEEAMSVISQFFEKLKDKDNEELKMRLDKEFDRINNEILEFYAKTANPGDLLYLEVYLKSQMQDLKKEQQKVAKLDFIKNQNSTLNSRPSLKALASGH